MEKGGRSLDTADLSQREQLSIYFQIYHAQLQLVNLGYEHTDIAGHNILLFRIDRDFHMNLDFGSDSGIVKVPYYGWRAALIDLDSIMPIDIDKVEDSNSFYFISELTETTEGKELSQLIQMAKRVFK
jgi:hypothetical protein